MTQIIPSGRVDAIVNTCCLSEYNFALWGKKGLKVGAL